MSLFSIIPYESKYYQKWNNLVENSINGTIFQRMDFLEYHKDRFISNEQPLIVLKGEDLVAVLPFGVFENDNVRMGKSPYGGSYGGFVFKNRQTYSSCKKICDLFIEYLKEKDISRVQFTISPSIISPEYDEVFQFCLLENSFKITNSDITSICKLDKDIYNNLLTSRARNMINKAKKLPVKIIRTNDCNDFWLLMDKTFNKHQSRPTHSKEEWQYLCNKFPNHIYNEIAYFDNQAVAGIGHIRVNNITDSSFYLCQDPAFSDTQVLSLLIAESLNNLSMNGLKYFDFGTSSVNMKARENIFLFKESFGATGYFRHTMGLEL